MSYDPLAWLALALRWLHVIAGVAWIGSSFYFVWLDNSLTPPEPPEAGVKGELWAVHGGGFYHSRKFLSAPPVLPETLHWFKWEAYTTWLSGFSLLALVFYAGAGAYLVDPSKAALTPAAAVAVGLGFIFGGLLLFEGLARSAAGRSPAVLGGVWFAVLTGCAFVLTRLFSDRGAFIHIGAMIGTVMAANVFLVIIPNQKRIVASLLKGEAVDPRLGAMGKQRSVLNNYMTLPLLLIMVSNHAPALTSGPLNWLDLAIVAAAGVSIRHFFNLRHLGRTAPGYLVAGAALFIAASLVASVREPSLPARAVTDGEVMALVRRHCVMCHSARPTHAGFSAPPGGVIFDSPASLRRYGPRVYEMAVSSRVMPLGDETGITDAERSALGQWIKASSKGS